ncbi:hypothetical protein V6N12_068620 [Hibiscus sabdariffa]|uniref:Uncharacterized protein n=1 Tax=Hibiscus sabdariffa TaxID=183260 RepID=A0ABR2FQL9_9ROSI
MNKMDLEGWKQASETEARCPLSKTTGYTNRKGSCDSGSNYLNDERRCDDDGLIDGENSSVSTAATHNHNTQQQGSKTER